MRALIEEAARLGVEVHMAELAGDDRGFYSHLRRMIGVRIGLSRPQTLETLGHELGHAFYGHECSPGDPLVNAENERQADRRGALLLIDPDEYIAAERIDPHPNAIAAELGVTPYVVEVWRDWWLPQILATGRLRQRA